MMKRVIILFCFLLTGWQLYSQEINRVKITDVEKIIAESKTPLIINLWATWCVPCIEELPYFLKEAKEHEKEGLKLLLVSLDFKEAYPGKMQQFISKRKITAPVLWLDETNADYFCPKIDPKWSGAIPATLFVNHKTGYRRFVEAQIPHDQLKKEINSLLAD